MAEQQPAVVALFEKLRGSGVAHAVYLFALFHHDKDCLIVIDRAELGRRLGFTTVEVKTGIEALVERGLFLPEGGGYTVFTPRRRRSAEDIVAQRAERQRRYRNKQRDLVTLALKMKAEAEQRALEASTKPRGPVAIVPKPAPAAAPLDHPTLPLRLRNEIWALELDRIWRAIFDAPVPQERAERVEGFMEKMANKGTPVPWARLRPPLGAFLLTQLLEKGSGKGIPFPQFADFFEKWEELGMTIDKGGIGALPAASPAAAKRAALQPIPAERLARIARIARCSTNGHREGAFDVWEAVKGEIEPKLNAHSYATWFRPTDGYGVLHDEGEGLLLVLVPNQQFLGWLEANYGDVVAAGLLAAGVKARPEFITRADVAAAEVAAVSSAG